MNSLQSTLRRTFLTLVACLVFVALGSKSMASDVSLNGHVGAVGVGSDGGIGYGAGLTINPYDYAAFTVDATFSNIEGGYFSSSPSLIFYPVLQDELRFGILAGTGFYKFNGVSVKFGLDAGVVADFYVTKMISVGLDTRYHFIFNHPSDAWNVFLTLGFRFSDGNDW